MPENLDLVRSIFAEWERGEFGATPEWQIQALSSWSPTVPSRAPEREWPPLPASKPS